MPMTSEHSHQHQNESSYVEHPQEHLAFAHKILEEHGVLRYRKHDDFLELLNVMKGHRLTMRVVIEMLKEHSKPLHTICHIPYLLNDYTYTYNEKYNTRSSCYPK